jgi:hypothetical protein
MMGGKDGLNIWGPDGEEQCEWLVSADSFGRQ